MKSREGWFDKKRVTRDFQENTGRESWKIYDLGLRNDHMLDTWVSTSTFLDTQEDTERAPYSILVKL